MTKAPTAYAAPARMADVARLAGVSKMTVSRVLAGQSASEATRIKVWKAVEDLNYVPDAAAGALSSGRSEFVAVLVPSMVSSNFSDTVQGLTETLEARGLQLLLGHTEYDRDREERLIRSMLRHQPRCIALTGSDHTPEARKLLKNIGIPVVEMWEVPKKPIDLAVGFSNEDAARLMVRHLVSEGYRRIAFLGGASDVDRRGMARLDGYITELAAQNLGPARVVRYGDSPTTMGQGGPAMAALLAQWPDTDAVMCVSDMLAFGAIMECHRRGLSVPRDIAVAGFGNFEVSQVSYPAISTVWVDAYGIGAKAGELLLAALSSKPGEAIPRRVDVEYSILARQST